MVQILLKGMLFNRFYFNAKDMWFSASYHNHLVILETQAYTVVQSAVFRQVQGWNSITKVGDISTVKYGLRTSYKYKIPRALCNLYVFKGILSRFPFCFWNTGDSDSQSSFQMQAGFTVPVVTSADACVG